ncbi:hypothetical protein K8T06_07690 [bacterium]|nr:hypothetical protein [bacterium]
MKKNQVARIILLFIAIIVGLNGFYGCSKNDSAEIFPPIVFKPVSGQLSGGAVSDNLVVTTVEKTTGKIIKDAIVFVHQGEPAELKARVVTDEKGVADFTGQGISGAVTVTVTCNKTIAYDTVSFVNVNAAQMIIPLERRKDSEKTRTALTFIGLDSGDTKLTLSRNDIPFKDKPVKAGNLDEDPWILTVPAEPMAFSALVMDTEGNTTKYGFTVEPDGPLSEATPAMINLVRVNSDNVKMCKGSLENPPANLDEPTKGWDPYKRYIFQVFADAGMAGDVVSGFANIARDYSYQTFIVKSPGLENMKFEVIATNRGDAWSETSTVIRHFTFGNAPETNNFNFINVPKNLQISKVENQILPNLVWESSDGNLTEVSLYHADYNYHSKLYIPGEEIQTLTIPPLELGSAGSLLADEIYRFKVTKWLVPGLDFANVSFQEILDNVTNRSASTLVKFMVKAPEEEQAGQ